MFQAAYTKIEASCKRLGGALAASWTHLGTVLNSCYAYSHTHRNMCGCHLCVNTLLWPRKHEHINGTLPERLLLMFAYTWSPARLPPMCAYFALAPHMCPYFSFAPKVWTPSWHIAKTIATHVSIQVDTCAVVNNVPILCFGSECMDT